MKNMTFVFAIGVIAILFTSCNLNMEAKVRFEDGTTSIIKEPNLLDNCKPGDTLFLKKTGTYWKVDNAPILRYYKEGHDTRTSTSKDSILYNKVVFYKKAVVVEKYD